jgi:glyceraldehyde 3-phosphate dehydrogenase
MKIRVAINGFGRIGRNAFKIAHGRNDIEVVAINDLADNETLAHLLRHDSNYPAYEWCKSVQVTTNGIIIDGKGIYSFSEKDPSKLPWKQLNVDVVIESTGFFTSVESAKPHITAGAKRVVISAPMSGEGKTIVLGVNDDQISEVEDIVSNASCTTNCAAPILSILEQSLGVKKSMMSTVHSYTASQRLQDAPHSNLRESRNAATNIIPSTTGASKAVASVVPSANGKFGGLSIRVPTPVVSLVDLTFLAKKATSIEEVNNVFKDAAKEPFYQGILTVSEEPLVSSDYIGNSHSAIVDLSLTEVIDGDLVRVVAWYDNEWGYSNRLVELSADVGRWAQESARRKTIDSMNSAPDNASVLGAKEPSLANESSESSNQQFETNRPSKGRRNRNKSRSERDLSQGQQKDQVQSSPRPAVESLSNEPDSTSNNVDSAGEDSSAESTLSSQAQLEEQALKSQKTQENLAQKLIAIEGDDYLN